MKQKSVKWWRYFFLLCLMGISVCMYASGGKRTLNGLVTDVEGVPVIGANILVKGQTTGVISDVEGKFSITVSSPKDVLVISYIGYNTVEMIVGEKTSINVQLTESSNLLNDVVVIGYGSMKKGEITSAITNVKSEDFIQGVVKDATQLLQGKVAGLQMASPSGDPTAGVEINIRGVSTISASSAPLIVIDGIPGGSLNSIAPEDVETIDVLKDGSAAAIYGTRGTNGVIIITTKKAKQGKASLEYHGYVAFESIQKQTDVLTASDYRRLAQDPLFKDNISDEGADVNWIDAITRNPVNHTHNLSLRGGTEKTNYIASITYRKQDGILLNTGKEALTFKIGLNHSMMDDKLKIQLNVNNSTIKQDVTWYNAYLQACLMNPTRPVYNEDGSYKEYGTSYKPYNPVALLNEETDQEKWNQLLASGKITFSPIEGLNLSAMAAMQRYDSMRDKWNTFNYFTTTIENKNAEVTKWAAGSMDRTLELTADYFKTIGKHEFSGLVGYSYQDFERQGSQMYAMDFPTDIFGPWNIGTAQSTKDGKSTISSYKNGNKLISFFGRLTYNYDNKYMLMGSLRREGSSKFGVNHKWGWFPAVSAGWRILEENFFSDATPLSNLKLRVGFGITGNQDIPLYASIAKYNDLGYAYYNGKWDKVYGPVSNPNPDLKWEKNAEYNAGVDFGIWNDRLTASVDYYYRKTTDLLDWYDAQMPSNIYSTIFTNVGTLTNQGIEFAIGYDVIRNKELKWHLDGGFSYNENKLVSLANSSYRANHITYNPLSSPANGQTTYILEEGKPIGTYYGLKYRGFNSAGKWVFEDRDEDGAYSDKDYTYLGNGLPKWYFNLASTLTWKDFDFSFQLRGAAGFKVLNTKRIYYENSVSLPFNLLKSAFE